MDLTFSAKVRQVCGGHHRTPQYRAWAKAVVKRASRYGDIDLISARLKRVKYCVPKIRPQNPSERARSGPCARAVAYRICATAAVRFAQALISILQATQSLRVLIDKTSTKKLPHRCQMASITCTPIRGANQHRPHSHQPALYKCAYPRFRQFAQLALDTQPTLVPLL